MGFRATSGSVPLWVGASGLGGGGSGFALSDSACSLGLGGVFQGGLTFGLGVFQRVFEFGSQEL